MVQLIIIINQVGLIIRYTEFDLREGLWSFQILFYEVSSWSHGRWPNILLYAKLRMQRTDVPKKFPPSLAKKNPLSNKLIITAI